MLAKAAAAGDRTAQERLFQREKPMLDRLAREHAEQGVSEQDLVQEGSLGLLDAIAGYASSGRSEFEPYAEERVRESMAAALDLEAGARRRSERLVVDAIAFEQAETKLRAELGRQPTPAEMAARLDWPAGRVDEVAALVDEARRRHDEELLRFVDPDYLDPLEWVAEPDGESE